jgi:hypothetical protein
MAWLFGIPNVIFDGNLPLVVIKDNSSTLIILQERVFFIFLFLFGQMCVENILEKGQAGRLAIPVT